MSFCIMCWPTVILRVYYCASSQLHYFLCCSSVCNLRWNSCHQSRLVLPMLACLGYVCPTSVIIFKCQIVSRELFFVEMGCKPKILVCFWYNINITAFKMDLQEFLCGVTCHTTDCTTACRTVTRGLSFL